MKKTKGGALIYQAKSGAIELKGDAQKETLWATQAQIAEVFGVNVRTVSEHLVNIFKAQELDKKSVIRNFRNTAADGKAYDTQFYNLDAIISVGYRVNSKTATKFRQWATKTLRQHITQGYTLNPRVLKTHYTEFMKAVENMKTLLPAGTPIDHESVLELVSAFADTWLSLEAYDKDTLTMAGATKRSVSLTAEELAKALTAFKSTLMSRGEATELFGAERQSGAVQGIVGNVMQSFGGKSVYGSVEEKAAHLLYFMVKNHPFTDGNKRSGAYAFVWFLKKAKILDLARITSPALTALTLLVAESDPKDKDRMVRLVLQLLKK